jgi:hypothetical protein
MAKRDLIHSLLDSEEFHTVLDKATALTLKDSADLCVESIFESRRKIAADGPKQYLLEDIENDMIAYRHLAYCYYYYTGVLIPTIEERLKNES